MSAFCSLHNLLECPICYTRPNIPEAPRSPAQPDALELLRELVACKDLKERAIKAWRDSDTSVEQCQALDAEYERRKSLAWQAARAFLAKASHG